MGFVLKQCLPFKVNGCIAEPERQTWQVISFTWSFYVGPG